MNKLPAVLQDLEKNISTNLLRLTRLPKKIKDELRAHAGGKPLKGDELVGWLGEIYGKYLVNGVLVSDDHEHDFEAGDMRVSVKARKGEKRGWQRTSAIPSRKNRGGPTHLLFIHLDNDYRLLEAWLYPWKEIVVKRLREHVVRGEHRSYFFIVDPKADEKFLRYQRKD